MQGNKFDDPNRMLLSVYKSLEGSTSREGNLRELCPKFYYLPELFKNIIIWFLIIINIAVYSFKIIIGDIIIINYRTWA